MSVLASPIIPVAKFYYASKEFNRRDGWFTYKNILLDTILSIMQICKNQAGFSESIPFSMTPFFFIRKNLKSVLILKSEIFSCYIQSVRKIILRNSIEFSDGGGGGVLLSWSSNGCI